MVLHWSVSVLCLPLSLCVCVPACVLRSIYTRTPFIYSILTRGNYSPHILPKMAFYMERGGDLYNVPSTTDCRVNVKRPSPTSCDGWTFQAVQACDHEDIVNDLGVMDAQWCKDRIGPSN